MGLDAYYVFWLLQVVLVTYKIIVIKIPKSLSVSITDIDIFGTVSISLIYDSISYFNLIFNVQIKFP